MRFPFSRGTAPVSRRRPGPRLRIFDGQDPLLRHLPGRDEPDPDDFSPRSPWPGDLRELLREAGWDDEIDHLLLILSLERPSAVAALLGVVPGAVCHPRERLLLRGWLAILALISRQVIETEDHGVIDPRRGTPAPGIDPGALAPLQPAVSSSLRLADLVEAMRPLEGLLAEDGVYLCVEYRHGCCRLWAGRSTPPSGSAPPTILPFPCREGGGDSARRRVAA